LEGQIKYVDLEGGFAGFTDDSGRNYDLFGQKAEEIKAFDRQERDPKKS